MKVKEILKRTVKSCTRLTSLDAVGRIMWEGDCGAVPVVDSEGKAVGMITDRDIAMAMAAKNRASSQILVREVVGEELFSCFADDDVSEAIRKMRVHRVRRLPVVDAKGQVLGLLSLKDLAKLADGTKLSYEDIALTLKEVCKTRLDAGERQPSWPWVHASER